MWLSISTTDNPVLLSGSVLLYSCKFPPPMSWKKGITTSLQETSIDGNPPVSLSQVRKLHYDHSPHLEVAKLGRLPQQLVRVIEKLCPPPHSWENGNVTFHC